MPPALRTMARSGTTVALVALMSACTSNGAGEPDATIDPAVPSGTVAIPAGRSTPFCQAMIDLSDRLDTDPPDDTTALIVATYRDIADQVPAEIADDFAAVLASLVGGPDPTAPPTSSVDPATPVTGSVTPDTGFDEGYLPGDTPALRLNAYVDFTCRDSVNNPGPPATQPLSDLTGTDAP